MKIFAVVIVILLMNLSFAHQFKCVFDENNGDLRNNAYLSKPAQAVLEPQINQGRLLTISPIRGPIRVYLDTSAFNTLNGGTNGAPTTTTTNLNFVLKTMLVTQVFYQTRLQVGQTAIIEHADRGHVHRGIHGEVQAKIAVPCLDARLRRRVGVGRQAARAGRSRAAHGGGQSHTGKHFRAHGHTPTP